MKRYVRLKCNHSSGFPAWADDAFSIFENAWGEQWIAAWRGDDIVISGGDIDWGEIVVPAADLRAWHDEKKRDLPLVLTRTVFNDEELHWLFGILYATSVTASARAARAENTEEP